jgi:hypothetical protein
MADLINMKILYSICSLNNLSQAELMFRSIKDDGVKKVLYLIDEPRDLETSKLDFEVIEIQKILPGLHERLVAKYNPFEVCCALKPIIGTYILENEKVDSVIYADTDLYFYRSIEDVIKDLQKNDFLLTPHFFSSPPDYDKVSELDLNLSGLYNGGFYAFSNTEGAKSILKWWSKKTIEVGFNDGSKGMFVDQIWLNYLPLYFDRISISQDKSLNVAYWNLHEREVKEGPTCNELPLGFYHFSGFRLHRPDLISIHQTRYSFEMLPALKTLFKDYYYKWKSSSLLKYNDYPYSYSKESVISGLKNKVKKKVKKIVRNENPLR